MPSVENSRQHYYKFIPTDFVWYKNRGTASLVAWMTLYIMGNFANGFDGALVNGLQLLPAWEKYFKNPKGSTLGLLAASQSIGACGAIPLAPFINDAFGRRKTVMLGGALMLTGASLQTASKSVAMYCVSRALLGFGGGFNNNADPLMVIELAYPSHRAAVAGSYNSITNVGAIVAAAVTFGTYYMVGDWSWRMASLIQVIPTAVQWSLVMFGPESPRWLMNKGREEEALKILVKYHGNGDPKDPMVLYEFEEMKKSVVEDRANKKYGWTHLFRTKGMRKRSFTMVGLAICGQWSGNSMISTYLNQVLTTVGITNKPSQLGLNVALSVWNFFWGFSAGFNADRFGRRRIFLTSCAGMLICFTGLTICTAEFVEHHSKAAGDTTILFIFLFSAFYSIGFASVMLLYCTEIVPNAIRSKAHSLWAITQQSMITFNTYVNPIAFAKLGWKYYIIFDCFIVLIGTYIFFFVPETKGYTLEETAVMFDGPDAILELQRKAEQEAINDKLRTAEDIAHHDLNAPAPAELDVDEKDIVVHDEHVSALGRRAV